MALVDSSPELPAAALSSRKYHSIYTDIVPSDNKKKKKPELIFFKSKPLIKYFFKEDEDLLFFFHKSYDFVPH